VKVDTVYISDIVISGRFDSEFHLSTRIQGQRRIANAARRGIQLKPLGGADGLAEVFQPSRFKRIYAQPREPSVPYLRPYDVFDYLPVAADYLSARDSPRIEGLRLPSSSLVLPASGRNLGPAVPIDSYLERFAFSHDAIRIKPRQAGDMAYVLVFVNSPTGQSLIRGSITGSVIDHVNANDVAGISVPILPPRQGSAVRALMEASVRMRERSRLILSGLRDQVTASLPSLLPRRTAKGWTLSINSLEERLDAAAFSPGAIEAATLLRSAGGTRLGDVAEVTKPASRYKAYHVSADYGRPFLAGGQIGQSTVIAPKYMADRVFQDPQKYRLRVNDVIFPADGRANEGLGMPVIVTPDRHGWLASEHIMRARPRHEMTAGWLYLALAAPHVHIQIQALARGSVVDILYPKDVMNVIIPQQIDWRLGRAAEAAWEDFATAHSLEQRAITLFEAFLGGEKALESDVVITVREAAAVKSTGVDEIIGLIRHGVLTPLGGIDAADSLLGLEDVLGASLPSQGGEEYRHVIAGPGPVAYGYVRSVNDETVEADVSDVPDGPALALKLPRYSFGASQEIRVGDRFLWWIRDTDATASRADPLERSVIKIVPRPILTADEVNESYIWADKFAREHLRVRDDDVNR
jgi:type I restriction enzyme, S subunit